ncbi:MAG: isoleucine--tRNA ligase [Caldiserica bacterium]|nr:isoleucine--tRNA ligase [Caldisericota bacterium]MDH7563050.1 isoleucine--tRNA ligase [Caldisericota bacterium]
MFKPVSSKPNFALEENEVLKFWKKERVFDLLRQKNENGPIFSFIDGPITANNPMGVHHAWGRTYKDLFQRYKAMLGYHQRYQNGFDCQGLWVEVEVEKELGFNSKREIEEFGLDNFSRKCKERVFKYASLITEQSIRLGMWMDWENSYFTLTDNNIEHIWHFLRKCYEKGWLYKGHRSMPWCIRCGTSLSQHELLGSDSYQEVTHTAVFLRLPVLGKRDEYFLVWTTTPWTLSANVALAVHPDLDYALVKFDDSTYILSRAKVKELLPKGEILKAVKGKELLGWKYKGPFDEFASQKGVNHHVIPWEEVGEEEGTGIVHIAPGCGAEDFELSQIHKLPVLVPIDDDGVYVEGYGILSGKSIKETNPLIFDELRQKGFLFKLEQYKHRYPVCWRCHEELVFKVVDEWFISTKEIRPLLIREAEKVHWVPESAGKRMRDWLENMGDWCISRKRFWGLPLPFYTCRDCGKLTIVGSRAELESLALEKPLKVPELHRPWIDEVKIRCPHCGGIAERIPEVGDCWLDAGIVPYSTLNYLHDRKYWEKWFPAHFITEMREQIRLWFYSMLFMSVTLEERTPYLSALVYEKLLDEKGRPMHRSLGNAIWFDEAVERMGADVMRWLYASQDIQQNLLFGYGPAEEVTRKMLLLWNVYSFFVTYANIDGFNPTQYSSPVQGRSFLDQWIISRLNSLIKLSRESLDAYDVASVVRETEDFVEDLSTWWLRRSRRRFWKSEEDKDKVDAYLTLYEVLNTLSKLLAPIIPFLTETLYQNLVRSLDEKAPISVHLNPYPEPNLNLINPELEERMSFVKRIVSMGRAARNKASIKVRQPLPTLILVGLENGEKEVVLDLKDLILEELNIKELVFEDRAKGMQEINLLPNLPLLGPKYGKKLPQIKEALSKLDGEKAAQEILEGRNLELTLPGEIISLEPSEVLIQRKDLPGFAAEAEGSHLVVLDTKISPELQKEGWARDIAHTIQLLRKEAHFNVEDRIITYFRADSPLKEVFQEFSDYLKKETLSEELVPRIKDGIFQKDLEIEGFPLKIALEKSTK